MYTDTVLKSEGMRILAEQLGIIEAERFIILMMREPFNYTEWQRNLYGNMALDDFLKNAYEYQNMIEKE